LDKFTKKIILDAKVDDVFDWLELKRERKTRREEKGEKERRKKERKRERRRGEEKEDGTGQGRTG